MSSLTTNPVPADGRVASGRSRILLAAERLIAEQGVAVSLREVAAAAGQKNTSAVHYHFGSRDGLIEAVVEQRQVALERERLALLAEPAPSADAEPAARLRWLVAAFYRPMFRGPYAAGSTHYARFLEKVRDHPSVVGQPLDHPDWPATRSVMRQILAELEPLPAPVREVRLRAMMTTVFALLADAERAGVAGDDTPGAREAEERVLDMLVGLLAAPHTTSPHTTSGSRA